MSGQVHLQGSEAVSLWDQVPQDALNLRVACAWCGWHEPIAHGDPISHWCPKLDAVLPIRRDPSIRLEWTAVTPWHPREETTG